MSEGITPQFSSKPERIWVSETIEAGEISYLSMPPSEEDDRVSQSTPFSVDFTFTRHDRAAIQKPNGLLVDRDLPAGTGGMVGGEGFAWVHVREPFECVEVTPHYQIRREVADELRTGAALELAEIWGQNDTALWASATRIRSHARGGTPLSELEADELIRRLLGHLICEHLGGRPARTNSRPMDKTRLNRIGEFVDANLTERTTVSALANIAAMSPFQFIRTFKAATGLAPHAFVTAKRMEKARHLMLVHGTDFTALASGVGYSNVHHFKRLFASHFGTT